MITYSLELAQDFGDATLRELAKLKPRPYVVGVNAAAAAHFASQYLDTRTSSQPVLSQLRRFLFGF